MNVARVVRILATVLLALVAVALFRVNSGAPHLAITHVLNSPDDEAKNWSCFRGPLQGISAWDNAPISWDGRSGLGVLWKVPLSISGIGSPVLWNERLFITEGNETERAVVAFDTGSGKQLWRQVVSDGGKGLPLPSFSDTGLALTSPACDSVGVYVMFGTGDLAAFSHDGTPKWQRFLHRPLIGYGYSSSPVILNDLVCIQMDGHSNGHVTALDHVTGAVKWEKKRSRGASWSSPMIVPGEGGSHVLVVNSNGSVTAYYADGKMAWDADGVTGEVTPSPAWWNGKLYPVHKGSSGLLCIDVTGKGEPKRLWRFRGSVCDVASPVLVNGLLFMASGNGELTCVDALTGTEVWTHKCPGTYASLVASGNRVYCLGRDGTTYIVAAEREFHLIATCQLGDGSDSTPALGNGRLYIRSRKYLWCIGER